MIQGPRDPNLKPTFSLQISCRTQLLFWQQLCRWRGRKFNLHMKSVLYHKDTICFHSPHFVKSNFSKELMRYEVYYLKTYLMLKCIYETMGTSSCLKMLVIGKKRQPENKTRHTHVSQVERWAKAGACHMGKQK